MRLMILSVAILAACIGWNDAHAQGCAGVTATQEDGSIKCFPPVTEYIAGNYDVVHSGDGLAIGTRYNREYASTDAVCVGCNAIVFSVPGRAYAVAVGVVEQAIPATTRYRTYYNPGVPTRYDAATDTSTASYVMHMATTASMVTVVARNGAPVTVEPHFANVD